MDLVTPGYGLMLWSVLPILLFTVWVIALADILKNDFRGVNEKLIWVLVVLLIPFIGVMLYFFFGRKKQNTIS